MRTSAERCRSARATRRWSAARIGQAYVTQSIADQVNSKIDYGAGGKKRQFAWGYHFGAVVAQSTDGADQVTMENYARKTDLIEGQTRLLKQLEKDFRREIVDLKPELARLKKQA